MKAKPLRILFVSSEAFPLIKTGGLADVSGSLPAALREAGADVRLLIPGYPAVLEKLVNQRAVAQIDSLPAVGSVTLMMGEIAETRLPVLTIVCPNLYSRSGNPYLDANGQDWPDNALRFGILSLVASILSDEYSPLSDWLPDIVHCNDWQTGLTPAYMHYKTASRPILHQAKSVMSLHNLAFQGNFHADWVPQLNLPASSFAVEGVEYYGQLSFLKAGIYFADSLSTVSPTYAREIQTAQYGFGLEGLLAKRSNELHGILNGIDLDEWNPASDVHLASSYDAGELHKKSLVKKALQTRLGLRTNSGQALLGVVSRLTHQKGLDLLLEIARPLLEKGVQIALLGSGDPELERGFINLAQAYPQQVSVNVGYNEPLSHQIMAGSDIFIMPSRFEPCGLNQMYGLRYGTPPVVTNTGGLADSVTDTTPASLKNKTATGFVMSQTTSQALLASILTALQYYQQCSEYKKPSAQAASHWQSIQRNGMGRDLGWNKSASEYLNLYQQLVPA